MNQDPTEAVRGERARETISIKSERLREQNWLKVRERLFLWKVRGSKTGFLSVVQSEIVKDE